MLLMLIDNEYIGNLSSGETWYWPKVLKTIISKGGFTSPILKVGNVMKFLVHL